MCAAGPAASVSPVKDRAHRGLGSRGRPANEREGLIPINASADLQRRSVLKSSREEEYGGGHGCTGPQRERFAPRKPG